MATRHTPGPWVVIEPSEDRCDMDEDSMLVSLSAEATAFVAGDVRSCRSMHLWKSDSCTFPGDKGYDEHLANAHLIAAAPDLLAALREAADFLAGGGTTKERERIATKALAAIARAGGAQ